MQREDYVMELQKHIDVDIYGACGQLSCPTRRGQHQGNCLKEVEKTHKFYLSFENSHCKVLYFCHCVFFFLLAGVFEQPRYPLSSPYRSRLERYEFGELRRCGELIPD